MRLGVRALRREGGVAGGLVEDRDWVNTKGDAGAHDAGIVLQRRGDPGSPPGVRDLARPDVAGQPLVDGVHRKGQRLHQVDLTERWVTLVVLHLLTADVLR